ncbi:MAG: hypothetical protein JXA74_15610 [Anaerolineae bacterium]|nr:hypothetical protein [Anaerolineae bacterium]
MERTITYFEQPGEDNTAAVFEIVDAALAETGIRKIVLASTRGGTARYALDHCGGRDVRLIIVPHQYGFGPTGEQRFPQELVARAEAEGHAVYFGTMLFHEEQLWGTGTPQTVANFLRFFCQGVKVCVEILLMAANGGLVDPGEEVVVVAGTGRGADTALVMTGGTSRAPKQVHISRILCKPL